MESNSGGGHLGGVAVSLGNGLGGGAGGGQNLQQLLQQPPHWNQQQQHFFNTEFGSGQQQQGGPGGQQSIHQQLLQQQQLMQLAAAAGSGPGQQGPPGSGQINQMAPTLNMMLQAAAAAQGLPHTLQSPPNNAGPGFLLLPGMGHPHQGQQGRDISPNSTPSLSGGHPPPSATPPNMAELSDRNWAAQQNMLFGGHRMMSHPDKLDDINMSHQMALAAAAVANGPRGMSDLFHGEPFANLQHNRQQQQEHPPMSLNQIPNIDLALARGLNPYQCVPAHSPPHMFHHPMTHQMPPRPRPEGGQDPSPNFLNEQNDSHPPHQMGQPQKKDDLVIGSWTDEDIEKIPQPPPQQQQQQHMFQTNFMMQQRPPMIEDKEPTGWGAPPPPNTTAAGGWGGTTHAPPPPHPTQHPPPNQSMPPRKPNWQPTNIFDAPPPIPGSIPPMRGGRGGQRGGGMERNRFNDYDGHSRGNDTRGGRGGYRGRGGGGPRLNVDHSQEKVDGKKSAIAETIAMMNKMKMEDKERKDAARQREEKRRELNPDTEFSNTDDEKDPSADEPAPPRRHGYRERGSYEHRGRGGRGGRGNRFMNGPNSGPIGLPMPGGHGPISPGGGLFMPPPPGGIPPFPGLENFMGGPPNSFPGSYPAGPGNPFYGMNPGQFNPGMRFPRGGGNRGQLQFGFPGQRGPFMPPMMPRHGGPMMVPRGVMGGRGMGRIGVRGQRGGRGGRGGYHTKENGNSDHANADKSLDNDDDGNEVEEFDRGQAEGVESDDAGHGGGKSVEADGLDEPSKNAISEQGTAKGQLALLASNGTLKRDSNTGLPNSLVQQLVSATAECLLCRKSVQPMDTFLCCRNCHQVCHKVCNNRINESGDRHCPKCKSTYDVCQASYVVCKCKSVVPGIDAINVNHACAVEN